MAAALQWDRTDILLTTRTSNALGDFKALQLSFMRTKTPAE